MDTYAAKQTHPLVIIAAIAVTLFCLAGIAALLGWLPQGRVGPDVQAPTATSQENSKAPAQVGQLEQIKPDVKPSVQEASPVTPPARRKQAIQPVAKTEPVTHVPAPDRPAPPLVQALPPPPSPPAEPSRRICADCGTIESVREIEKAGEGTGLGAVGGAVAGGVLGHQVGGGRGRDLMTVLGAVGGGLAGHQIEKNARKTMEFQVAVRFEDGSTRLFTMDAAPSWRAGDRVRVVNGVIQPNN